MASGPAITINSNNNVDISGSLEVQNDITTSVIKSANSRIDFDHSTVGISGLAVKKLFLRGIGHSKYGIEFEETYIQGRGTASNSTGVASIHLEYLGGHVYFNHQGLNYYLLAGGGSYTQHLVLTVSGTPSDDRLKFNETALEEALPLISQMQVKRYQKTSHIMTEEEEAAFERGEDGFANRVSSDGYEKFDHISEIGIIAQELHTVLPTAVTVGSEVKSWKVKYDHLTCVAIKAIQELSAKIESLEARISTLENNSTP